MSTDPLAARLGQLRALGRQRAEPCAGLGQIALQLAEEDPDRVVVTDGTRSLTRAEMVDLARRLGGALLARGLEPGAVIALQLPNWWEACVINLTAALFGYRIVPLLPIYRAAELGAILPTCGVSAIFVPPADARADYRAIVKGLPDAPAHVFTVRGDLDTLLDGPPANPAPADSHDAKMVIFTSGSTGRPKGAIHTHASMDAVVRRTAEFWGIGPDDTLYVPSPVGHVGGSVYAFEFPWLTGCRVILEESWYPARAVARIDAMGATFMAGATPFLRGLLDAARASGTALPSLRRFICGGASVPADLIREALTAFPSAVISRAYGSTEVPLAAPGLRTRAEAEAHADTDGAVVVEHRLAADGEIALRGPQMCIGYLDPEDDAAGFTEDGFFLTGDLGRITDGCVTITGRKKDIIIRKGENISPVEVEEILLRHPAVDQVALVGAPDAERGEMVVAFVVTASDARFGMAQMTAHLTDAGLARQKFPERLDIVAALPMNAVGKVQKPELRRWAAALVAGAATS